MTALWSWDELTAAFGAAPTAALSGAVEGVSIDSRTLQAGDLFIAIKGDAHDGHDHVARAFESGAVAAVVSREAAARLAALGPLFAVDDTLGAMERLGMAARARSKARIVAVTGSVGKTTAKEMLRTMLSACGAVHASAHSYNNHWGVPLTLARMPASARFGVFEIGMNHAGEIAPLTRMARPHAALVTTIAPVHIEHLGSIEAIADAKAEIFLGLEPGGAAALNRDAPQFERLAKAATSHGARVLKFGRAGRLRRPAERGRGDRRRIARDDASFRPRAGVRPRRSRRPHGGERAGRAARRGERSARILTPAPPRSSGSRRSRAGARAFR